MSAIIVGVVVGVLVFNLVFAGLLFFRKPRPVTITPEWFQKAYDGEVVSDVTRKPVYVERHNRRRF